jgi:holo-[acyl-carrier protein] synthase
VSVAVGIDLVAIDEVRESLRAHGERYLNRIYTEAEQRECGADPRLLAARFAAKEATAEALRLRDEGFSWRSIGVARDGNGSMSMQLTGEAAALAEQRGVLYLDLSLTVRHALAMAVVIAELEDSVTQSPGSPQGAA